MTREPLAIRGAVIAAVQAALTFAVLMGLDLTPEQVAGAMALVATLGTLAVVLWTRGKVTPISDPRDNEGNPMTGEVL